MKYLPQLLRTEMRALAAIAVCSVTLALLSAVWFYFGTHSISQASSTFLLAFFGSCIYGFPVVTLYGAPLYTWLKITRYLTWSWVIAIGALPGVAFALVADPIFAAITIAYGCGISSFIHVAAREDIANAL
jgi:hypothetical protein